MPPAGARPLVLALAKPRPQAPPTEVDAVVAGVAEMSRNGDVGSVKGGQDRTLSLVSRPVLTGVCALKGGQDRTLSAGNCPVLTGVSAVKGGQGRTLFDPDGAKTPAKTPAPNARAGRNPRTPEPKQHPPSPPEGGSSDESITIEETYLTDRGRRRRRRVNVNLDEVRRTLGVPGPRGPCSLAADSRAARRAGRREHVRDMARRGWDGRRRHRRRRARARRS